HEMYHKVFTQGQPQISDFLQTAEQRQGMDAIDKFAKSKARYPLLGMHMRNYFRKTIMWRIMKRT
ncbi:MAG: hypothetical protein WAM42_21965, partial [Candidatus Nitrosopolaris sp.]